MCRLHAQIMRAFTQDKEEMARVYTAYYTLMHVNNIERRLEEHWRDSVNKVNS